MALRRRAFFLQICSNYLIASSILSLLGFDFLFSTLGSGLNHSSLPDSLPLTFFDASLHLKIQRANPGSDHFMGISQRPFNLFPLKNAPWVDDVDGLCSLRCSDLEACPHLLSVEETYPIVFSGACFLRGIPVSPIYLSRRFRSSSIRALIPQHPSRPISASIFALPPPPVLKQSCKASGVLGFLLMGLIHFGLLSFSSWANNFSGGPLTNYTWARSVSTYGSIHSWNPMSRLNLLTGRGLRSKLGVPWIQVLVDQYPARSNQFQLPYLTRYPLWKPSMARSLSPGASFIWLRSVFYISLPESIRMTIQYLVRNGRGHRSWVGLMSFRWFWDKMFRTLVHRSYLVIWPNYSCKRRFLFSSLWERSLSHVVSSPLMAEGLAMRAAIETASTLGFIHLVMESDSLRGVLIDIVSLSLVLESVSFRHSKSLNIAHDELEKVFLTVVTQT